MRGAGVRAAHHGAYSARITNIHQQRTVRQDIANITQQRGARVASSNVINIDMREDITADIDIIIGARVRATSAARKKQQREHTARAGARGEKVYIT